MKTTRFNPFRTAILVVPLAFALSGGSEAAVRTKAATGTDLTAGTSWDTLPGSGDVATWNGTSLGGALTIGSDLSWQGIDIQGATAAITTSGSGLLTLGTSGITIAAGGVDTDIQNSITIGADQNWTVGSGRILTVAKGKTLTLSNNLTTTGSGSVALGGSGATTLTGSGVIEINGGTFTNNMQTGSSSAGRSGATTLTSGNLVISTSISMFGSGTVNLNGGALGSGTATGRSIANTVNIGGNVRVGGTGFSTGTMTFSGPIGLGGATRQIDSGITGGQGTILSGTISNGGITLNSSGGTGILTLSNDSNSYAGATTVTSGYLAVSNNAIANSSSLSLAANTRLFVGVNGTTTITNLSGDSAASIRTDFTITGTSAARTLKVNQSSDGTFAGSFTEGSSRTISLLKSGTAKLTLSGTGGYTGGTTISQGTLAAITNGAALGSSGTVTINDANTGSNNTALLLGSITMGRAISVANQGTGTTTLGANSGAGVAEFSGAITLAKGVTLDGTGNTDRLTFTGGIGGTGGVTISGGTARVVFAGSAANSYNGTTTISANSILQLGVGSSLTTNLIPDASVLTLNNGSFLKLAKGANSETIGGLTGTGTVRGHEGVASVASAIVINNSGNHSFDGVLENGGASGSTLSVTKDGAGTQTLTNTNTYTGNTSVTNGKLIVNGSISTSVLTTVDNGASLGGSGTVGALTVNGTLAPGNSIESIGTGNLSFGSTSTYAYELETALYGTTPGVAGDLTYATGTLNIASGAILTLTDLATSTALADGSKLTLISYTGLWNSGLFTYLGNTLADGATFTLGANEWKFDYNDTVEGVNYTGDSVGTYVTMTVVPEPGAALLGGLGLLALLRRRREA